MSFKDYFDKATTIQALANKSAQEIGAEVESVGYHEQDIVREERFIPQVDYTQPGSFARYGLAEEYYSQALKRIYDEYPYDGSLEERVKWENDSTYLDLHIFDKEYPRTNGYVLFSPAGWGSLDGSLTSDGYGLPATQEYIAFSGGPHPNPDGMSPYSTQFTGSNYYETAKNRENNLKYDLQNKGVSVEFWLKKAAFDPTKTQKEVVYDLWNGGTAGSDDYGRLIIQLSASGHGDAGANPFLVTLFSGNVGIATASVCPATVTTASVADNAWHHYAFTFMSASTSTGVDVDFYIDGNLSNTTALNTLDDRYGTSAGLNEVTGALRARIGALVASPSGSTAAASAGKLSASLDEFRYWKIERTGKEIGRHWFTQVGGGTNDDPTPYVETTEVINTNLGVYYKFNEGITGVEATDSVVLDYSGRISNGAWTGYVTDSRSTGSAIVESSAAIKEFKDPIIYSFHPEVVSLSTRLQISGSNYDTNNNASIYNSIPSWMVEEDIEGQSEIKHLTQILSSYFDTLHLQVESLSKIQNVDYVSGSSKPYPFADRRLASQGLFAPNLFLDADVLEKLADRSEDRVYEKSLTDIKNTIYQNIYNNLVYIYKSKGTEKAFRNMIRCFGIDDELVKLNAYAGNLEYDIRDNRRIVSVAEKFVDFNTADGTTATVFQFQDPTDTTNTSGYLPGNAQMTGGYAQTLEADILFPLKPDENSATYVDTNVISSSLFGMHGVINSETDTAWDYVRDASNFQVYAVRDEVTSDNARFVLTGTAGGFVPALESELFEDVYSNTHWNLSVRIKPEEYPWAGAVAGYSTNYIVELHGVQLDAGIIRNEFTVSDTITAPAAGFVSGSKRTYVGAHRTNFTGTVLQTSDVKVDACRYWLDYLDDKALAGHAFDTQNYGSLNPHYSAFPFVSSSLTNEVLQADTLVFNWEFSNNTGSNASGQFRVADESSGSAAIATSRFRWAGPLLGMQYTSLGYDFAASTTKAVDKDFILSSKLQLPENVQSSDMVNVLSQQDQDVFTRDSRPINYFFAFEKSMAQAVSVEMINYFATLKDINNLIGAPVNRYRTEYKGLRILRQRFFERVSNDVIDFDKFYEFYKWFDTSLSTMIQQLVPASADFAENVRTLVESHVLERSKYQHKFQNVKQQLNTIEGTAVGSQQTGEMNNSPDSDPQGTGFYSLNAFSRRQLGSSQPIDFKSWNLDHAPLDVAPPTPLSLLFDGADEYVNIGTAATWDALIGGAGAAAKAFSFSFWLKPAAWVDSAPGIITFGTLDRGLVCNSGTGPANTRLFAKLNTAGSYGAMSSAGELTINTWQHITVTYPGGSGGTTKIYVNASEVSYDSQPTGAPDAIAGLDCVIGAEGTDGASCLAGNMADVAVWDKALSTGEISEIYGGGQRVKLTLTTCKANLLSWWQLGNGTGDTYNGTLADEVGGRNGTPINFDAAGDIEADSPVFSANYNGPAENSKAIWWRSRAGRGVPTISSSYAAVNTNKQVMLKSIEKGNTRAQNSVYRFGAGGNRTLGGVGTAANKKADFVFKVTQPFGAGAGAAPENVMVGLGSGVEQLINTTDEYHPAFKQRLGFDMNPDVNRGTTDTNAMDGNVLAPFSLYSSSVESNVNRLVADNYATGTMITNLHHDLVYDSDIPAQGPFTEKFVGGREYRHQPLNSSASQQLTNPYAPSGLDSPETRPEGWKIEFYGVSSSATTEFADPMIAVVPPNFDGTQIPFYNEHIPTGNRLRNVGTKRPVNIRNIKMTTSSIGNYEKNYQVVQSNSRRKNDPYFNDQSFDFAVYPETAAPRTVVLDRRPVQNQRVPNRLAKTLADTGQASPTYMSFYSDATYMGAGEGEAYLMWVKIPSLTGEQRLFNNANTGRITVTGGKVEVWWFKTGGGTNGKWIMDSADVPENEWFQLIVSYRDVSAAGVNAYPPEVYINGVPQPMTKTSTAAGSRGAWGGLTLLGMSASTGLNGQISEFALFSEYLSPAVARALYRNAPVDLNAVLFQLFPAYGAYPRFLNNWYLMGDGPGDTNEFFHNQTILGDTVMNNLSCTGSGKTSALVDVGAGVCERYLDDFALPDRSGTNSNQSIIVNHFSSPGEYKTLSRGYLDPAHEELSVYNASPYRNRGVIDYGLSGSASVDETLMRVQDQISKPRGLDQRAQLHCGRFGSDAAYGSVVASTYVTVPSWHKTNRNPRTRMQNDLSLAEGVMPAQSSYTASVYDNLYVQHQIPQSEQQYSWITASMASGEVIYGLDAPSCGGNRYLSSSALGWYPDSMSQLITGSQHTYFKNNYLANFVGMNDFTLQVSSDLSTHLTTLSTTLFGPLRAGTFNGTTSKLVIGTPSTTPWDAVIGGTGASAKAFTLAAWIAPDNASSTRMIFSFGNYERRFYWSGTNLYFNIDGATDGTVVVNDVVPVGEWTHVAATFKGGNPGGSGTSGYMKLYVNGVLQTVTVSSELNNPDDINEGTFNSNIGVARTSDYEFDGEITEAAVWDEELTAADISAVYGQQFEGVLDLNAVGVSDLIAYYKFDTLLGDSAASVINRATSPTANTNGAGTDITLGTYRHLVSDGGADYLKIALNNQNGPYGWPTWKQIRAGESKTARRLRNLNFIGQIVPPPTFDTPTGFVQGLKANTFVDYIEQPVASNAKPVFFAFEDNDANPDVANNLAMNVSYQNNLDYFSNEPLNNRLGVNERRLVNVGTAFNTVADFTLTTNLSTVIRYGERIYPAETNVYQTRTRTREDYSIADIWNDVRALRSVGAYNSSGHLIPNASVWPLDPYSGQEDTIEFNGESEGTPWQNTVAGNGAGELQSGNTRFSSSVGMASLSCSAQYIMPFFAGTTSGETVMANCQPWHAAESSSNGPPYQPYLDYAEKIRLIGKDMSIVPEFRISEHIGEYLNDHNGNFLTKLDNVFTLTGSSVSSSAGANFYKLYSTADFMKYFKVVDDELADKTNGGSQPIRRHSIELSCDALLQFLPYKGFYPAERTIELTSLLSQSLGAVVPGTSGQAKSSELALINRRVIYEPLVSPGILFNTIKSGIAVSSMVVLGTASAGQNIENTLYPLSFDVSSGGSAGQPQKDVPLAQGSGISPLMTAELDPFTYILKTRLEDRVMIIGDSGSIYHAASGLYGQRLPFEALRDPEAHLDRRALSPGGLVGELSGTLLWDTGTREAHLGDYSVNQGSGESSVCVYYDGSSAKPHYKLAIDNFLCETVNFFQTPLKSFVSKPEEEFLAVKKDRYYGMQVKLATPYSSSTTDAGANVLNGMHVASNQSEIPGFGMYGQETAFGPLVGLSGSYPNAANFGVSPAFAYKPIATSEPWLPPYWYGYANVNILFKAPYSGKVSLDDILGNSVYEYQKVSADQQQAGAYHLDYKPGMEVTRPQITASVNIDTKLLVVPPGTTDQQARWLIQSKFETPVQNFYMTPSTRIVTGSSNSPYQNFTQEGLYDLPEPRGMWHQKGNKLEDGNGIILSLGEMPPKYTSPTYGDIGVSSLSKIVGFQATQKRIGDFAEAKRIEEAIVCVPFLTDRGNRRFFDVDKESQEYVTQLSLLNKYIFPPTFDFLINQTVDPIAFYAFEFSADFSQDDLINIWQNMPPESSTKFQKKTATIKIQSLVNRLLDHDKNLQWMVFKVKRRAEKDYNVFTKKGLVDGLPIVEPAIDSPYSYNWPYDFFSLVELIKIDEDVVYATEDLIPEVNEGTPVIPDLREFIPAPEEMSFRIAPGTRILNRGTGEDDEPATSRAQTRRSNRRGSTTGTARTRGQATTRMATTTRKKRNKKR